MDGITLYNQNGQKFDVDVVRYFKLDGKKYLIFSLNEKTNGYTQLYVSRVEMDNDKPIMRNITDDTEWSNFKDEIQKIVVNNRNNLPNQSDLEYKELDGCEVDEFRIFKLKDDVAKTLGENKNVAKTITEEAAKKEKQKDDAPKSLQAASAKDTGLTIEQILQQVSEGAKNAREVSKVKLEPVEEKVEETFEPREEIEKEEKPKTLTIDDLLNSSVANVEPKEEVKEEPKEEVFEPRSKFGFNLPPLEETPVIHEVNNTYVEPMVIPSDTYEEAPVKNEGIDYKAKYDEVLVSMRRLEEENMRLINDLIEAKAKIETIKDLVF